MPLMSRGALVGAHSLAARIARVPASIGPRAVGSRRAMVSSAPTPARGITRRPEVAPMALAALSRPQIGIPRPRGWRSCTGEFRYRLRRAADEPDGWARIPKSVPNLYARMPSPAVSCRRLHHRSVKIALRHAAAAELSGTIVWHYDENPDRRRHHWPTYEWIVPRGTLNR